MSLRCATAFTFAGIAIGCATNGVSNAPQAPAIDGGAAGSSSGGEAGSSSGMASSSGGGASSNSSSSSGGGNGSGGTGGSDASADSGAGLEGGDAAGGGGPGPCDIYQSGGTPCVAAHSTVRALYASYSGKLYQVQRVADDATLDIHPTRPGGYADSAAQDAFCAQTNCTLTIIYDQSSLHNDLSPSPPATQIPNGGTPAIANAEKITMAGAYPVYGLYVAGGGSGAYRNNHTTGVATGNQAESMYMVVDGARHSGTCCFDYGNAEADGMDDGNGTMEAIYWGSDTYWGGQGEGSGPWIAADLENGMFKCNEGFPQTSLVLSQACPTALAQSIAAKFATAMLKGPADDTFKLKSGDAQSGPLVVQWDGARPSPGYSPKSLQGAIIIGTGGDGSGGGQGTFFEGAMTAGNPPDAVDDLIQANIVAAGYGP